MSSSGLTIHDRLEDWLKWQESAHATAWDFGLERIEQVWQRLGAPRLADKIITVAGTNGKGSCVRWLETLCLAHGASVASFTSPHLLDYRERIRFNGQWVSGEALVEAFVVIDAARAEISLSYFEWSALAAFYLMAQTENLALAVLEVGLGGRLDATNIINADAVIITTIGLDHTQWLGQTIAEIATEKAGVMRAGQWVVFSDEQPPQALFDYAATLGIDPQVMGKDVCIRQAQHDFDLTLHQLNASNHPAHYAHLPLPQYMHGEHQLRQFAACVCVLGHYLPLQRQGLLEALKTTHNPARLMSIFYQAQPWLLDVAHNADSAKVLSAHLAYIRPEQQVPMICGMLKDKDAESVFSALDQRVSCWYLLSLNTQRGADQNWLFEQATKAGVAREKLRLCGDITDAVAALQTDNSRAELGVVMGSFLTVGAALALMNINVNNMN